MPAPIQRLLLGLLLLGAAFFLWVPALPQDLGYHQFADQRTLAGIPHFWNVISNLPFVLVGLLGLHRVWRGFLPGGLPALRPNYALFFLGMLLIGFGSGYYHLAPCNDTLVWDRLPMTISFMAFLSGLIGEHGSAHLGRRLLMPLVLIGGLSVLYWYGTELRGYGDLRPYVLVQFFPMLLLPILLLSTRSALTRPEYLWAVLAAYTAAKLLEWQDVAVLRALGGLSGHTLKHVVAAAAGLLFLLALARRRARKEPPAANHQGWETREAV